MPRSRRRRSSRRKPRWRRRLRHALLLALAVALFLPPLQVACLRVLPPLMSGTRVQRAAESLSHGEIPRQRHDRVPLEQVSPELIQAVLVAEDQRYWAHRGFDLEQVERAVEDHLDGEPLRGASTLSMQTSRTLFLWQGRSWGRKALEAMYTVYLEAILPKDRILELYLNEVEWGPSVFGAEAAAQVHFGCSAAELSRDQACALAAILPDPRGRDPTRPSSGVQRKIDWIHGQMDYPLPGSEIDP